MLKELYEQAIAMSPKDSWPTYDGKELDRTEFLTSSEVTRCLRWTFFSKYPEKYPLPVGKGGSNGYAERGHAIEAAFVKKIRNLEAIGYRFEYVGDAQRSFYDADLGLSGTPDGIMYTPDGRIFLMELKSIDPRFNKNNLPKKGHMPQTIQNMYLVTHCIEVEFDGGILFYIDASDIWSTKEFAVTYSDEVIQNNIKRSDLLWAAEKPDDLEPEGVFSGDCDLCPYTHHCSQTVTLAKLLEKSGDIAAPFSESVEPTDLAIDEVHTIETWLDAKEGVKQYESEVDEVKVLVQKIVLDNNGFVKLEDGRVITASMDGGRESIDKSLLVGLGVDLEEVTKRGKPFVTLRVKEPK